MVKIYGAYTHARPDGKVFYVGKGTSKRAHNLYKRPQHHKDITKIYDGNILIKFIPCYSEKAAFKREKALIKFYREQGVILINKTSGGQGVSGMRLTKTHKKAIGRAQKGKPKTQHCKILISKKVKKLWEKRSYRKNHSEKQKLRLRDPKAREKIRRSVRPVIKKMWKDPEYRARITAGQNKSWTKERRAKYSAYLKKLWREQGGLRIQNKTI